MTDELLDRVRAVDPLPEGSMAPPFESVYAALEDLGRDRRGRRRGRLVSLLAPAVGIAVAAGVIVAAITLLHPGRNTVRHVSAALRHHSSNPTSANPRVPTGGMSGIVTVWGAGFDLAGNGVISLQQCSGCQANGNQTSHSTDTEWLLRTDDGGRTWQRSKVGYYLQRPALSPQTGWAGGLELVSRQQGGGPAEWEPGSGIARFFVTHDGGRSWSVAPSAAPNLGGSTASLAGGEAWAVGLGLGLNVAILHAPDYGNQLTATASQPIHGDYTNVHVLGAGTGTAYVINADAPRQAFVTHDDGRTWQHLTPPPCTGRYASAGLDAAFLQTVWVTCSSVNDHTPTLVRSTDGGRTWQKVPGDWGQGGPQQLSASAQVAWALNTAGVLFRTTNAGASWQQVWSANDPHVSPLSRPITRLTASPIPILSVQSADSASIVTLLNRGTQRRAAKLTNLVVYQTTNGGQTWHTYPVQL